MDIRELLGWTVCARCKKHWNDPNGWMEYPIDFIPSVVEVIQLLQSQYSHVYVRHWDDPVNKWFVGIGDDDPEGIVIRASATGRTEYDALVQALLQLNDEPQHYSVTNPAR